MNTIKLNQASAKMVAHRGVSGLERENTCAAFVAAGNRSYFGIETDVHRTADGHFVCIHDSQTGRVGIDDLNVEKSTLDTLRSLVLTDMDGTRARLDLRIPTLREYVRICKRYGKIGVLELKSDFTDDELQQIIDIIAGEDYLQGIIFIAFNIENLQGIRRIRPEHPCQFLCGEIDDALIATLQDLHMDLDVHYKALTQENLAALHQAGIQVNVWTVDDPATAETLASWGVDYITSNILE